jgi:hypothetical protein
LLVWLFFAEPAELNVAVPQLLYPFGIEVGDSQGPFTDCNNGFILNPLTTQVGFPFFGTPRTLIYVSTASSYEALKARHLINLDSITLKFKGCGG